MSARTSNELLTREQAAALIERIIKLSRADEVQVMLEAGSEHNVRLADNRITTSGSNSDVSVTVYSAFGRRAATSAGNDLSAAALEQLVRQSETLARLSPENPEALPLLKTQTYSPVRAYFEATAEVSAEARAKAVSAALERARKAGDLTAAGLLEVRTSADAVGNNAGLFAYHPSTAVNFTTTVRTNDGKGSGWAGANDPDWSKLDVDAASERATGKARLSRNATPIEPGRYTVILEPQATGDLVSLMRQALDARSATEGRSPFSKAGGGTKLGEKIMDARASLVSDPADPAILARPFDNTGLPLQRQEWVKNGVLSNLVYSRFWAQKQNRQPTGNASTLMLAGGNQSLEDIIAETERAILVTRFWYIRGVNPRTLLFTGLTRDGTFLVENGKITRAVQNMRFNESPLFMLDKLEAIGRPVRLAGDPAGLVMPALRVRDFHFTSLSDAV